MDEKDRWLFGNRTSGISSRKWSQFFTGSEAQFNDESRPASLAKSLGNKNNLQNYAEYQNPAPQLVTDFEHTPWDSCEKDYGPLSPEPVDGVVVLEHRQKAESGGLNEEILPEIETGVRKQSRTRRYRTLFLIIAVILVLSFVALGTVLGVGLGKKQKKLSGKIN
jgi:hypothetical protein